MVGVAAAQNGAAPPASNVNTQLVGCAKFRRSNPRSDRFTILKFHHCEFWTGEATMTAKRCVLQACGTDRAVAPGDLARGGLGAGGATLP